MKILTKIASVSDRHWFIAPLAIAVASAGFVGFLRIREIPAEVVRSTITASVQPGGKIVVRRIVRWRRADCVRMDSQGLMVDSLNFNHPIVLRQFGSLYPTEQFEREIIVPFTMPWGESTWRSHMIFACFPFYGLWPVTIDLPDMSFHVAKPSSGTQP